MSTIQNRPFLLLSVLIHLVAFLSTGQISWTPPQHMESREAVAVRLIDFSPAENAPEEIPDTAKIWSSKATRAHGGTAEEIAELSRSTLTASTPPKGEPFSFQRTDSSTPATAVFSPDEPSSAEWLSERLAAIAALDRPIRLELEPALPDQAAAPQMPLRDMENPPLELEGPGAAQEFEEAPTPRSRSISRTVEANGEALRPEIVTAPKSRPVQEAAHQVTVEATDPAAPTPPEPSASTPEKLELPRSPLAIEEGESPSPIEATEQARTSISRATERPAREPLEPRLADSAEKAPLPLKGSSARSLPLEAALAGDLAPSEETAAQPEPVDVSGAEERSEALEVARQPPPAANLRTRLRLEGTPRSSPGAPKAGKEVLGPEELFPTDIIEKYAAMESGDVDLTDVSDAVSLDTNELRFFSYFAKIKKEIEEQWRYPEKAALRGQHGSLSLLFVLDQTGKVKDIRFWKTSGYELLDLAAKDAILEADPFPPFPEHLRRERSILRINVRFIYELYGTI